MAPEFTLMNANNTYKIVRGNKWVYIGADAMRLPLLFKYNSRGKFCSIPSGGFLSNGVVKERRRTQFNSIFAYIFRSFLVKMLPFFSIPNIQTSKRR